jgi:hypothetical protein
MPSGLCSPGTSLTNRGSETVLSYHVLPLPATRSAMASNTAKSRSCDPSLTAQPSHHRNHPADLPAAQQEVPDRHWLEIEARDLSPALGPFIPQFRPFAAKPLILAAQSGIIGLHDRSDHVQESLYNGGQDVQDYPKRARDTSVRLSGRCGNRNLGLSMAATVLDAILRGDR